MSKRKERDGTNGSDPVLRNGKDKALNDSEDSDDGETVDVDFEWFDPQPIDFNGLKVLLRQLFDTDNTLFDLSALADLILSQPLLGSTVKVSDDAVAATNETDPFAFLTVLNLTQHRDKPEIKTLKKYVLEKSKTVPGLEDLKSLLEDGMAQVGLILTERFINMPTEVVPPMYHMLVEEIDWAVQAKEPYKFTHYLILSKTYTEVEPSDNGETMKGVEEEKKEDEANAEQTVPRKKAKRATGSESTDHPSFYFHPEDEVLEGFAIMKGTYQYSEQGSAEMRNAFAEAGIRPQGTAIVIEAERFGEVVKALQAYVEG